LKDVIFEQFLKLTKVFRLAPIVVEILFVFQWVETHWRKKQKDWNGKRDQKLLDTLLFCFKIFWLPDKIHSL